MRRNRRRVVRYSLLTVNVLLLGGAIYFVTSANSASSVLNPQVALITADSGGNGNGRTANPLDQLSSTEIAVHVSRMTHTETTTAVTNQADSVSSRSAIVSQDDTLVSKPEIMTTNVKTKNDIVAYTVAQGDTVSSLARDFGVTSDSIRWSNDLTSWSTLRAGQELVIPPIDGIVYTVQADDTAESLSERFSVDKELIVRFNDAELEGLQAGDKIVIPDGQPRVQRQQTVASTPYYGVGTALYGRHNGYVYGYCTWHVANRRAAAGRPLPSNLGHARTWAPNAQRYGMTVTEEPAQGAVLWHKDTSIAWGLGHVGYVERVNENGSIVVSDMNYPRWNAISQRTIEPSQFGAYLFIQ